MSSYKQALISKFFNDVVKIGKDRRTIYFGKGKKNLPPKECKLTSFFTSVEEFQAALTSYKLNEVSETEFKVLLDLEFNKRVKEMEPEGTIFDKFQVFINLNKTGPSDEFLFLDKKTKILREVNAEARLKNCRSAMSLDSWKAKVHEMKSMSIIYDLTLPFGLQKDESELSMNDEYIYNKCKSPEWAQLTAKNDIPSEFKVFFESLFPKEEQRRNVFAWASRAVRGRAEMCLGLFGGRGIGKTFFVGILKKIVGDHLSKEMPDGFWESRFNNDLENISLAIFDEVYCTNAEHSSKLRRNLNRIISIEEKQKNTRTIECYASFLFMANEFEYLRVDPDERRFYLPDVGKEENKASPEVYDYLDKFLKQKEVDPQLLRDIVEYFDFNKNDNFSFSIADKSTETFWAMVKDSAFPPMRFVIETMESCIPGVEKSYAELSREWDMKKSANFQFPYFNKIKAFLLKYKPHGREIITCDDTLKSFKYLGKGEQDDQHGILRF